MRAVRTGGETNPLWASLIGSLVSTGCRTASVAATISSEGGIMVTKAAVWLSAVLFVLCGCGQRWQSYSSTAGGFSVSMPGVPTYSKETLHPAGLTIDLHKFKLVFDR